MYNLVPDPDLQIGVEGGGGGGTDSRTFFPALRASVWSKNKRGGGRVGACPGSATVTCKCINGIPHEDFAVSLQKAMPFT